MAPVALASTRVVQPPRRLRGDLRVPGDKSITHRALLLGAMATGTSRFAGPGIGADTCSSAALIRALGARHELSATELVVHGRGLEALREPAEPLDEAGRHVGFALIVVAQQGQLLARLAPTLPSTDPVET